MKSKRTISYIIQSNIEGGFDIVQNTQQGKIIGHTDIEEAAKEVINILTKPKPQ